MALLISAMGTLTASGPASAAADPPVPVAQIGLNKAVYDRYDPIVVDIGVIGFFPSCAGGGVRDFIYPWADIYIIRGLPGGTLTDVNGAPNAVQGGFGGGFFDEVIGYAGVGSLHQGTYSIVVDECQDGKFGPGDTLIQSAFRVRAKTSVTPMLGIATLKANAGTLAKSYKARGRDWQALVDAENRLGYAASFLTQPPMVAIGVTIASFVSAQIADLSVGTFPNPKEIIATEYTQKGRHYEGIEKDPPDRNYTQLTTLSAVDVPGAVYDDPTFQREAPISAGSGTESALAEALLHSIERYQGAQAQGDGGWALRHARQAQQFARLLADQQRSGAAAYGTNADALEADTRLDGALTDLRDAYDAIFTTGLTPDQEALIARSGLTRTQVLGQLSKQYQIHHDSSSVAEMVATLRSLRTDAEAMADDLDQFATDNQSIIDGLVADPWAVSEGPEVTAGGPYGATVGSSLTVSASATAQPDTTVVGWAWDLDGDGSFDDGTGASATFIPDVARRGLVAVQATDSNGETNVAYARLVVTGNATPGVNSSSPASPVLEVPIGSAQPFTFVPASGTVIWTVDGIESATGSTFSYTPAAAGLHRVSASVDRGAGRARDWDVYATFPDLDGDGYGSDIDCDDNDDSVYPGAPELLDGKDNDCDPSTPDGGKDPAVTVVTSPAGVEGVDVTLAATVVPSGATAPYTATIDWGDGAKTAGTVTATTKIAGTHAYRDDGEYSVTVCAKSAGKRTGCTTTTATISNAAPTPTFSNLFGWLDEGNTIDSTQGPAQWVVAPDGQSVLQTQNSDPGFFVGDTPLPDTEVQVGMTVETTGDDDFIGFVLGVEPGFTTDPAARWLLVDWKKGTQSYGCGVGLVGLALSYVEGIPNDTELWGHNDCLATNDGSVTELARAANLGSTGWVSNQRYQFRIDYTETHLAVYVDDVLEFEIDSSELGPGATFPQGGFGFYNYSQDKVRYTAYDVTALSTVEGADTTVGAQFLDSGADDTHIGRFGFGDGTPEEAADIVEANGSGTATTRHTYVDNGTYDAELCVTDDDGAAGCRPIRMRVANAAPLVEAGRDRTVGPSFALDDTTFSDAGVLDTHAATIDWGDGTPVEPVAAPSALGHGTVVGTHAYGADGDFTVTVCVTDNDGDTGCDAFAVTVLAANQAPTVEVGDGPTIDEGSAAEIGLVFSDPNTSDRPTVAIDWGDGSSGALAPTSRRGSAGSASSMHTYADDGSYLAKATVCDDFGLCADASTTVTVLNVAPQPIPALTFVSGSTSGYTLAAPFTDPGTADTHTATIDWGDGSPVEVGVVADRQVTGQHHYPTTGRYTVTVCVTDDDQGVGCAEVIADPVVDATTTTSTSTTSTSTSTTTSTSTSTTSTSMPPTTSTSTSTSTTLPGSTSSTSTSTSVPATSTSTSTTMAPTVVDKTVDRPQASPPPTSPEILVRTGTDVTWLAITGFGALLMGAVLVRLSRRRLI